MASMGIRCGGKNPAAACVLDPPRVRSNQICQSNRFVSIPNSRTRNPSSHRISASIALSNFPSYSPGLEHLNQEKKDPAFSNNLDGWVKGSVVEIVKNLRKAPLLVQVYGNDDNDGLMEVKTEKGCTDNWDNMKKTWREGEVESPDGIILVEELKGNEIEEEEGEGGETKAWGVLIQGKGVERELCRPVCYLLKTCRVNSGLGCFGTHFSLVEVKNFRETAFSQIKDSWLLQ